MNEMNELFNELWWLSDQREPMNEFVEAIKEFTEYMKGGVYIALIDLFDFGYQQGYIFIAFDDYSGGPLTIFPAGEFVKYYKEIMNYDPEICPQDFWTPKLKEILEKYQ